MIRWLQSITKWLCDLKLLKNLAHLSCHLRSCLYNVGGILGISFAANLMIAGCTRQPCQAFSVSLFVVAPISWISFGVFSLIYSITFNDIERNYVTEGGKNMTQFIDEQLLNYNKYAPIYCAGMTISFFICIVSMILGAM